MQAMSTGERPAALDSFSGGSPKRASQPIYCSCDRDLSMKVERGVFLEAPSEKGSWPKMRLEEKPRKKSVQSQPIEWLEPTFRTAGQVGNFTFFWPTLIARSPRTAFWKRMLPDGSPERTWTTFGYIQGSGNG